MRTARALYALSLILCFALTGAVTIFTGTPHALAQDNAATSNKAQNAQTDSTGNPSASGKSLSYLNQDGEEINYRKIFDKLPPDIQKSLEDEAQGQFSLCNSDPLYSRTYDCRCMAVKYLDERIKRGPETSNAVIRRAVQLQCVDVASLAGLQYQNCQDSYGYFLKWKADEFCKCYANSVAKYFAKNPSNKTDYLPSLGVSAAQECDYDGMMNEVKKSYASPYTNND